MSGVVRIERIGKLRVLIAILLAVVLGFGLTACSSSSEEEAMSSESGADTAASTENTNDSVKVIEPEETEQEVEESETEERSYEELVDRYVELSIEADAEGMYEELYPEEIITMISTTAGGYDQLVDYLQSSLESDLSAADSVYGSGWSMTHDIASAESIEASSTAKVTYRSIGLDIEDLKEIQVDRTITTAYGSVSDAGSATVYAVKIGNSWYLEPITTSENASVY